MGTATVNWRRAVAAGLVSFLAALTVASITVHNAAYADERHPVALTDLDTAIGRTAPPGVKGVAFAGRPAAAPARAATRRSGCGTGRPARPAP